MVTSSSLNHKNLKRICEIMKFDKYGGKIVQRDEYTAVIADCSKITDAQIHAMQIEYPHVYIEIIGSCASMSGFCIIVYGVQEMVEKPFQITANLNGQKIKSTVIL